MAYRGIGAVIPLGRKGLVGTKNPLTMLPDALLQAENITYEGDAIQKDFGRTRFNATALSGSPKIVALWDFFASASEQFLIAVTSDGKIYRDAGAGTFPVTLKTGLTVNRVTHICEGGADSAGVARKLFFFNGKNVVQVLIGSATSTTDLTTPPADWSGTNQPTFGISHGSRIFSGGNDNDPNRLYFTRPAAHELYTGVGSGTISVYPGEGERLVGGLSYRGRLFVFKKPRGVYLIDDSPLIIEDWSVKKISNAIGLGSPWSITETEDDVVFRGVDGLLYLLSAVQEFGNVKPRSLVDELDMDVWLRDNLDISQVLNTQVLFHAYKRLVVMVAAGPGKTVNDTRVETDLKREFPRFKMSRRDVCQSIAIRENPSTKVPQLISGSDDGFVYIHDQTSRSNNGAAYKAQFQIPFMTFDWLDKQLGSVNKKFEFLRIVFAPTGSHNVAVDVIIDGSYRETILFNQGDVGAALGSFVLGTSKLGGAVVLSRRRRLHGFGYHVSLIFYNTGLNENFNIMEVEIQFRPGAHREKR